MRAPSLWQILIIVLIIVVIFGAKRLPDVASSIGKSLKIFKKEVTDLTKDDDETTTNTTVRDDARPEFRPGGDPGTTPNPPGGPGSDQR